MLRLYRNVFLGETTDFKMMDGDSHGWENWILVPLCILVILIGVYPSPLLNISAQSVQQILQVFTDHNTLTGAL